MKKIYLLFFLILTIFNFTKSQEILSESKQNCYGKIDVVKFKSAKSIVDLCNYLSDYNIHSFVLFYQPKLQDGISINNFGATFNENTQLFINKAKAGDVYYFEDIRVIMPDNIIRKIPGIAFKID